MDDDGENSPTPSTESEGQSPSEDELNEIKKKKQFKEKIMISSKSLEYPKGEEKLTTINPTEIDDDKKNINKDNKNTNIPSTSKNPTSDYSDEYAEYITYNADGVAIYTDPKTNYKYIWSQDKNTWIPDMSSNPSIPNNPYENEHYLWCTKTNQWISKPNPTIAGVEEDNDKEIADDKLQNEFYKWDKEKNQWIPTNQSTDVSYEYIDGLHTYKDKDGVVFFWDTEKNAWFPKIDDDFMAIYQMNYGFIDNTSSSSVPGKNISSATVNNEKLNQKISEVAGSENLIEKNASTVTGTGVKRKAPPEQPKWFDLPPEQNTKVYVSNLPLDITIEEYTELMSKCGMIMRDPQTQKNKLKLYTDTNGMIKGDGLCDYIKVESVELALNILDGYDVRGKKISVQRAKFQMRGDYNPALKPKKKKKDKEKLLKMKEKLFDWRPEKMRGERSKHERVVIIKNLFTPELFNKEVALILEYQKDLRDECSKCGTVRKVIIYDRHTEGVAQISMGDPEQADTVVQMMNGRYFGQRKLTAELWDGKAKYKIDETEGEVENRLTNWDKYLEDEEQKEKKSLKPEGLKESVDQLSAATDVEAEEKKSKENVLLEEKVEVPKSTDSAKGEIDEQ